MRSLAKELQFKETPPINAISRPIAVSSPPPPHRSSPECNHRFFFHVFFHRTISSTPKMPPINNPVTAQELSTLSTKAIDAKAAAYCVLSYRAFLTSMSLSCPLRTNNLTYSGPYSKFRVGACILTASGEFVVGANVENVAYPVGTCAERVAFATAIGALIHDSEKGVGVPLEASSRTQRVPGNCRCNGYHARCITLWNYALYSPRYSPSIYDLVFGQWTNLPITVSIREFTTPSFPVYMYDGEGNYTVKTMGELLPDSFGPDDLPK
ncbi:hypothetical protein F1880_001431 [Penicillium rolfsii]|nr:hypothetical protein F1880_001431 [Penicillium rolfsii]